MAKINLPCGKTVLLDKEDYDILNKIKWHATKNYNKFYARSKTEGLMHRLIIKNKKIVDHINGNGLDNRKENLRACTHRENIINTGLPSNNKSGYKGVHWSKNAKKWTSQIKSHGKIHHLGLFTNKWLAAKAYNVAAVKYFGKFAYINNKNIAGGLVHVQS